MQREAISDRLCGLLQEHFGRESRLLQPSATLRGALMLDSLDLVDLAFLIGREFGVVAGVEDYRRLKDLDALTEFIYARVAHAA